MQKPFGIQILAAGDLHLGRASSGIPDNPPQASTKHTWDQMVDLAIGHDIDVLLLLGDIVDQDNRYFEAVGPLLTGFEKLRQNGIQVFMVSGNHDHEVLSQIATSQVRVSSGRSLDNVHLLGRNGRWEVKPFSKNGLTVQFAGWSFPAQWVSDSPLHQFDQLALDPTLPVVGMLHCDLEGRESNYAPVSMDELIHTRADAWLLGHIHKPQKLREQNPAIWYTGSPHAMSAREPGIHGPLLLTIEGKNDLNAQILPLSPIRYETIRLDVSASGNEGELRDLIISSLHHDAESRQAELERVSYLVYDLELEGEHRRVRDMDAWTAGVNNDFDLPLPGGTHLSVRKTINMVQPQVEDLEKLATEPSPAGVLADTILADREGRTTGFLNELLSQWNLKFEGIRNSGTFLPLRSEGRMPESDGAEAKASLLRECNRLLNELLAQREQ